MKIAVLAIGTELTTGQINNTNAPWFAKKFKSYGVDTHLHLTVPDDRKMIQEAFRFCSLHAEKIFVTGGLGPTSDDFTRVVFADWLQRPLEWDESSWQHIHERLTPRGIRVKEIQKQQCYFPQGSRILKNRMGTANGFTIDWQGKTFYFLPGPPKEIQAIWEDGIESEIKAQIPQDHVQVTHSWDTIGLGESDIAEKVIESQRDFALEILTQQEIGYRVHLPYVEVKLTYPKKLEKEYSQVVSSLEKALSQVTVLRDGENIAESLGAQMGHYPQVFIQDLIPGGFLTQRIFPFAKDFLKKQNLIFSTQNLNSAGLVIPSPIPPGERVVLTLHEEMRSERFEAKATCRIGEGSSARSFEKTFRSDYAMPLMREREQQYFAELAMIFWRDVLRKEKGKN